MSGSDPPPPPARQVGQLQPTPPSRHGDQGGGGGGVGEMGFRAIPPLQSNFLPAKVSKKRFSLRFTKIWEDTVTTGNPPPSPPKVASQEGATRERGDE